MDPELSKIHLGIEDYWVVHDLHYSAILGALEKSLGEDPATKASRLLSSPAERQILNETRRRGMQALSHGDWTELDAYFQRMAHHYVSREVKFSDWFKIVRTTATLVTPYLVEAYGPERARLERALTGMHYFFDHIISVIGTHFIDTKTAEHLAVQARLRRLSRRMLKVREEEGRRIAREVHDVLGQSLTAIKLDLAWVRRHLDLVGADEAAKLRLKEATVLVDMTLLSVQQIAMEIRPGILDDLGLKAAIEWLAAQFRRRHDVTVTTQFDLVEDEKILGEELSTTIFRILQEALTNVSRHAKAKNVLVRLELNKRECLLNIDDDGIGIPSEALNNPNALGIEGMRERAMLLDGKVEIRCTAPRTGTAVKVHFNLSPATFV